MIKRAIFGVFICFAIVKSAMAINCFVCDATNTTMPFQCSEWFERYDTPDIVPNDCSDVHEARYCVKHVGRFEVSSINCFQCRVADTIDCSDKLISMADSPIKPLPCDDVIDAQFCVKSTSLDGGIGAKRYCSSKDLGNYCNYVQNIGDQREYRSCIYTCSSDGCNSSTLPHVSIILVIGTIIIAAFQIVRLK